MSLVGQLPKLCLVVSPPSGHNDVRVAVDCNALTEQNRNFPDFYITPPQPCPYLPGRRERKVFTHLTNDKPPGAVDQLLRTGFRRSQNIAYTPYCDGCNACVSVRILVDQFDPGRTFRRTLDRNRDLIAERASPEPSQEQYALFRDYIDSRHGDGGMADMSVLDYTMMVQNTLAQTHLTEYRQRQPGSLPSEFYKWPLLGVSLCDRLTDGISMVYSYYDPEAADRSLGTYMILEQIQQARKLGLPYLYLGYWVRGSRKMSYKSRYQPQEHLTQNGWIRVLP